MKTVAIIHGWAGGPRITRYFANELAAAGFKVVKNPEQADIIFAHSAGVYKIPKNNGASLIIFHCPPYWPGKSIISRLFAHAASDAAEVAKHYGLGYLATRRLWETYYVFRHPSVTVAALRNKNNLEFLSRSVRNALLTRNKLDKFCSPEIKEKVKPYKNIKYVEFPGGHDDYIRNPKPYIDLLLKELEG